MTGPPGTRPLSTAVATTLTTVDGLAAGLLVKKGALCQGSEVGGRRGAGAHGRHARDPLAGAWREQAPAGPLVWDLQSPRPNLGAARDSAQPPALHTPSQGPSLVSQVPGNPPAPHPYPTPTARAPAQLPWCLSPTLCSQTSGSIRTTGGT